MSLLVLPLIYEPKKGEQQLINVYIPTDKITCIHRVTDKETMVQLGQRDYLIQLSLDRVIELYTNGAYG